MKCLSEVITWVCLPQLFSLSHVHFPFDFMSTCSNSTLFPLLFLHVLQISALQKRATPFSAVSVEDFFKHAALWAAELMIPGFQQLCVSWLGSLTSNKVWLPIKAFPVADTVLTALSHVDSQRSNKGELIARSRLQWKNAGTLHPLPDFFFFFSKLFIAKYFLSSRKFQWKWPQSSNVTEDTQKDIISLGIGTKTCYFHVRLHLSQSKDWYLKSGFALSGIFFP